MGFLLLIVLFLEAPFVGAQNHAPLQYVVSVRKSCNIQNLALFALYIIWIKRTHYLAQHENSGNFLSARGLRH